MVARTLHLPSPRLEHLKDIVSLLQQHGSDVVTDKEGRGQGDSSNSTGVRRRGRCEHVDSRKSEELQDAEASGRAQIHRSTSNRASPVVSQLYARIDKVSTYQ